MEIEQIKVNSLYENQLDMRCFARMLESPTQSYKFYWLGAILRLLPNKDEMTFEEVVFEMFWDAWYTVSHYHLHLGPTIEGKSENWIEHAVHIIEQDSDVILPMRKEQFMRLLVKNQDKIKDDVDGLIKNVPYRLLSSFMAEIGGNDKLWDQKKRLIAYLEMLNENVLLPYVIINGRGAMKKIHVHPAWKQVLLDNYSIVKSWVQMKKVKYLQDRNPGVPGIIYKLEDEENKVRKLDKVRELWLAYETASGINICDLYSGEKISSNRLSIDHFVPWSYVAHDEFWNLSPTTKSINSSKSNHLPDWDLYFQRFAELEYLSYRMIWNHDKVRQEFHKCAKEHLNSPDIEYRLYREGLSEEAFKNQLQDIVYPVYQAAQTCGFSKWQWDKL